MKITICRLSSSTTVIKHQYMSGNKLTSVTWLFSYHHLTDSFLLSKGTSARSNNDIMSVFLFLREIKYIII